MITIKPEEVVLLVAAGFCIGFGLCYAYFWIRPLDKKKSGLDTEIERPDDERVT